LTGNALEVFRSAWRQRCSRILGFQSSAHRGNNAYGTFGRTSEDRAAELCRWMYRSPGFRRGSGSSAFSNPMRPQQTACYIPEAADPQKRVSSDDVFVDSRGLLCLIDRMSGLTILERT
jgi:hypothetical protein